ncbi:hypothetical protein ACFSC3_19355 [Sphingomonas floccifaciens]|uniref:Transposase n=1 Tax=Sphingomonas floccifaciens TaxID=1844115 RepID=A0ABW4NHX3_9SPHN
MSELQDRIVTQLVRDHGGTKRDWKRIVGRIRLYDPATHPHCNWALDPSGTPRENAVVERMMDDWRLRVRIVTPG